MGNNSSSKWLTGCAVGCGALLILVLVIGLGLFFYGKRAVRQVEEISQTESRVEQRLGSLEQFCPDADGRIQSERLRAFIQVRKATAGVRSELGQVVRELEAAGDRKGHSSGFWDGIRAVRTGVGAIPKLARLRQQRADAMLQHEMSPGEYMYIYSLAYYSWLKKDPGDGPFDLRMGDNNDISWGDGDHGDSREQRRAAITRKVQKAFIAMLGNARRQGEKQAAAEKNLWLESVEKELSALESEWSRVPWADGLPEEIEQSLEPFREDLKAAYDPATNLLEFLDFNHSNRWVVSPGSRAPGGR